MFKDFYGPKYSITREHPEGDSCAQDCVASSVSFHGSTLQQLHRDFKLIGTVLVFKPYANDYCNTNSKDAEDDVRA